MKHELALTVSEVVNISITILSDFCSLTLPFLLFISALIILLYRLVVFSFISRHTSQALCTDSKYVAVTCEA